MELSRQVIRQVVLPTAAFYTPPISSRSSTATTDSTATSTATTPANDDDDDDDDTTDTDAADGDDKTTWSTSLLNPKNRIDSLDWPADPAWRIDGCIAFGTQFYAVPLFLGPTPPHRVDVFIPDHAAVERASLRRELDLGTAFYTRDARQTRQLGVARHIVRCLQHWTETELLQSRRRRQDGRGGRHDDDDGDDDERTSLQRAASDVVSHFPFGSRIVFQNLPVHVADARIVVAPTHYLERQMLSVPQLEAFWRGQGIVLPPAIDASELVYRSQPHDSVSVVEHSRRGRGGDGEDDDVETTTTTLVFKAVTSHTKFLYHELRQLLLLPPHPNIIRRPLHLVTKRCGFGSKTAVVGFTLEYHPLGTVRDHIPRLALHGRTKRADEVRWALQLVSALRHLHRHLDLNRGRRRRGAPKADNDEDEEEEEDDDDGDGDGDDDGVFYSDIRLDNILLSESNDLVMVDFEQRGVWSEFAAPEINAIECVRELATATATTSDDDDDDGEATTDTATNFENNIKRGGPPPLLTASARARYAALLTALLPGWESLADGEEYTWPAGRRGYNVAWRCLGRRERESCEVYMLGRVLWCLAEAQSAPQRAAVWTSYPSAEVSGRRCCCSSPSSSPASSCPDSDHHAQPVEFPRYSRADPVWRRLIDRCTAGRLPTLGESVVVRDRSRLVLRDREAAGLPSRPWEVRAAASAFWADRVASSEEWVRRRVECKREGRPPPEFPDRPSLAEVQTYLEAYQRELLREE